MSIGLHLSPIRRPSIAALSNYSLQFASMLYLAHCIVSRIIIGIWPIIYYTTPVMHWCMDSFSWSRIQCTWRHRGFMFLEIQYNDDCCSLCQFYACIVNSFIIRIVWKISSWGTFSLGPFLYEYSKNVSYTINCFLYFISDLYLKMFILYNVRQSQTVMFCVTWACIILSKLSVLGFLLYVQQVFDVAAHTSLPPS